MRKYPYVMKKLAYEPGPDTFRLAAAYCYGVVKNRPFIDGNQRTGFLCAVVFLGINGVELQFDELQIVSLILGLAASEVSEFPLAQWLRESAK
jgi:death on curing protein